MKKYFKFCIILVIALNSVISFSQNQTKKWLFGSTAGIDFVPGTPIPILTGAMNPWEGCASIADASGALLFYTDGISVWNKLNAVMPNGTGLMGNSSSTQSGVIVKQPGNPNIYFIFTTDAQAGPNGLRYTTVDMSLAAGNGSVTAKNTLIFGQTTEKLTAVRHCNGVDIWVLSHDYPTNNFRANLVTAAGVGASVLSAAGPAHASSLNTIGQMKASPNGRKLAYGAQYAPFDCFHLYDFNNSTGVVSNFVNLGNTYVWAYGVEFSPDGTKLYGVKYGGGSTTVTQWDVCSTNTAAIVASAVTVGNPAAQTFALQLATDGKIYAARIGTNQMGVINNPNVSGVGCNYVDLGFSIAPKSNNLGLPNFVTSYLKVPPPPFTYSVASAISCLAASFTPPALVTTTTTCAAAGSTVTGVQWTFGDPPSGPLNTSTVTSPSHTYPAPGTYTAQLIIYYNCTSDTVKVPVTLISPTIAITTTSATCSSLGSATVTAAGGAGPYTYTWTPSAQTTSVATGLASGAYTVVVKDLGAGCTVTGTTNLGAQLLMTGTVTSTSVTCNGSSTGSASLTITGGLAPFTYTWTSSASTSSVASGLAAGIYTVVSKDASTLCSVTKTVQITQPPALTLTPVANTPTACAGGNILLTATTTGGTGPAYTYTWNGGILTNTNSVTQATGGAYTYSVSSKDANNCLVSNTISVTFVNNPTLTATSSTICVGQTATLTANGATAYLWNPGAIVGNTYTSNAVANSTITVTGSIGACTATAAVVITVNALPTPTAQSNSPICQGQTLNLIGLGGTTYTWSGPAVYTSNLQNPSITSASLTTAGVYSLNVTDVNGCKNNTTTNVVVNALPVIVVNNPTVCLNQTISFTANGGTSYSWSGPGAFASALQNPTLPNATIAMSGQYTVTVTSALGCTNTAISTATVYALPNPAILSNTPCVGSSLNLSGSGGATYSWLGPNGFNSVSQNPNVNPVTLLANGTYSLLVTSGTCSASITASVTVNPLPVIATTNTNVTCFGLLNGISSSSVTVGTGPFTYVWSSFPVQNGATATNLGAGNYNLQVTDNFGCVSTKSTQITQPTALNLTINSNTTSVCAGIPINLNAVGNGGTGVITYSWNSGPATAANSVTQNTAGNYMYTVTATDANNCAITQAINLTFFQTPTVTATSATVCEGQTAMLSANGANSYVWLPSGATGTTFTINGTNSSNITVIGTSNGCSNQSIANLVVNSAPNVNITTPSKNGCLPLCVDLKSATTSSIVSYSWSMNNAGIGSGNQISNYCFTTSGSNTINLSVVDVNGCASSAFPIVITLNPQPVADFNYDPIKPLESVDLVSFTDASYAANIASWNWYFMNNGQYTSQLQNPTFMYADAGEYMIALVVKSDKGCSDTILKSILVGEDFGIYVPNTFTPNGDGLNDIFYGKGFGIKKFEMQIFDRWGEKVFTSTDLNEAWDGSMQNKGSKQVQEGVYTWRIKLTNVFGKSKELTGHVTLIK